MAYAVRIPIDLELECGASLAYAASIPIALELECGTSMSYAARVPMDLEFFYRAQKLSSDTKFQKN